MSSWRTGIGAFVPQTRWATIPATRQGNSTGYSMRPRYRTSMPKRAPETGVPKTAANPAPTPQITRRRRSLSSSRRRSAKRLVIAAPICAHGPSLPTEPPNASVTTVARSLTGATSQSTLPERWWIAAMTASVPCPFADGANVRMSHTHRGNARGRRKYGRKPPGNAWPTSREEAARDHRKARVPQPTQAPATAPSSAHFKVVTTSAACSVYHRPSSDRRGGSSSSEGFIGRSSSVRGSRRVQPLGQGQQDATRGQDLLPRQRGEGPLHQRLDRPGCLHVETPPRGRKPENGAAAVPRILSARDQPPPFQPPEDAGEGAGVQVQDVSQLPRGDRRKPSHDANDEALGTRDPKGHRHSLRAPLQPVIDRPEQPHELERLPERRQGRARGTRLRTSQALALRPRAAAGPGL